MSLWETAKVFKDKIYCTQDGYAFAILFQQCACLEFYYTSLFLIIFFILSTSIAAVGIRYTAQRAKAMHSKWHFYLLLSVCQLFKHGTVFTCVHSASERCVCPSAHLCRHWLLPGLEHSCRTFSAITSTEAWLICPLLNHSREVSWWEQGCWHRHWTTWTLSVNGLSDSKPCLFQVLLSFPEILQVVQIHLRGDVIKIQIR